MDFFETLLGMSPDGGDGTSEAMWVGAIALAAVAFFFRRRVVAWIAVRTK
jgi:LPXTG-motif cell wall-anchored protein